LGCSYDRLGQWPGGHRTPWGHARNSSNVGKTKRGVTCNRHHRLRRHAPANDPGHYRLSCCNALPGAVGPTAAVRKRVSTDMVLAQQFTRHIAGWSAFARKCRQALLPGRNAFAHLDQAIHLPKSVTCSTLVLIFLSPSRFSTVHPWCLWTAGTSKGRKNRRRSKTSIPV